MRESWASAPYRFIEIATCPDPACRSPDYKKIRTEKASDGTKMKKVICRKCGSPYKIVLELPETGNDEMSTGYYWDSDAN